MNSTPSVFESFNARNLSPRQVAKTFIPPVKTFSDLLLRSHSLIIGPRGSGKTTLLKMLQLPALAAWTHPEAEAYRNNIDFTGVFIPTDISWGAQLDSIGTNTLPKNVRRALGLAAFTTHVLISFVDAMRDCLSLDTVAYPSLKHHAASLDKSAEVILVQQLASNWRLKTVLPTLNNLKLALRDRISEVAEFANKEANTETDLVHERLRLRDEFHIDFIDAIVFGIEAFGIATNYEDRKWALLFDELEIAPQFIRRRLFKSLRSTDQRILYKLSISPYSQDVDVLESSTSAMAMQDYKTIDLWYPRKEVAYKFCESLLQSMIDEYDCPKGTAEEVLGSSEFDQDDQGLMEGNYIPGSRVQKRFEALASKDSTFSEYLKKYSLDLNQLHLLEDKTRASFVRKVTSVVAIREAFRSEEAAGRSRKNPDIYTGARSVFAIVEGNPRWFIGLVGPLLKEYKATSSTVDRSTQASAISAASNKFRALLKTIPYNPQGGRGNSKGLLSLLDKIGNAFHNKVVKGSFNPEPPLSFIVDANCSPELLGALGRALNAGAIIYVPDDGSDPVLSSLRGKRFRLSYMLAPHYKLPLLLGSARSLSALTNKVTAIDLFHSHE